MSIICLDVKSETLEVTGYNGNSEKRERFQLESRSEIPISSQRWNFFRQENNHAYVHGGISYEGDCKNNVIISPYRTNRLVNVKDAFIFVGDLFIEVSPISDISNAINKGKRKLSNQEINYYIPKSVFERENLGEKDIEDLKREIAQRYRIKSELVFPINSERTKNCIYYVKGEDEKEYVLKFRGRDKERAEILSQIAENIPNYFPTNFRRRDSASFTFEIGEELYGLEEFIRDVSPKTRDLRYFSLLGAHMGLLHGQFSSFIDSNKESEKVLVLTGEYTTESNLVSLYLDLSRNESGHRFLLSELERIIEEKLDDRMDSFPKGLIHRDLNHSNLIWRGDNFKIVDSETINIFSRLHEFESPLLFRGDMEKPIYTKNSLSIIVHAYNQSGKVPLSKEEIRMLPYLLKYALLRNFVVRKIRRGLKDESYLDKIKRNLELIDEDSR